MPIVKPISGHTTVAWIQRYLEKNDRALARDFFNLSWDDNPMEGYDEKLKEQVAWAAEMDAIRAAYGNDAPFGGRRARTFKHYIVSPDPDDSLDLERLRELTRAWVNEHFADYQSAIVYHDDNEHHIPHAHVVVNNTNLVTGKRLQTDNPLMLNRSIQDMAEERRLSFLRDETAADDGFAKLASKDATPKTHVRSRQEVYMSRSEKGVVDTGAYSWVSDIRDRVAIAKNLARNEAEFRQILDLVEVDVADNSRKAKRDDWIFTLRDQGAKHVSGERLGTSFGKTALQARFARGSVARPDITASKQFLKHAGQAVEINDLVDLHQLATTLDVIAKNNFTAITDFDSRIDALSKKLDATGEARKRDPLVRSVGELATSRDYAAEKGLLPQQRRATPVKQPKTKQQIASAARKAHAKTGNADALPRVQRRDDPSRSGKNR